MEGGGGGAVATAGDGELIILEWGASSGGVGVSDVDGEGVGGVFKLGHDNNIIMKGKTSKNTYSFHNTANHTFSSHNYCQCWSGAV